MKNNERISLIKWAGGEYIQQIMLRDRVLKRPIGISVFDSDLRKEKDYYHAGYFVDDYLVGYLIAIPIDKITIELKELAVEIQYQKLGIGKALVEYIEKLVAEKGVKLITLKARVSAMGFYQKSGYKTVGDTFDHVGIPHIIMEKLLS